LAEVNQHNLTGANKFPQRLHRSLLVLRRHVEPEIVVHPVSALGARPGGWTIWLLSKARGWPSSSRP
jgi:hypothetical protein